MSDDESLQLTYTESQLKDLLRDVLSDQSKKHSKAMAELAESIAAFVDGLDYSKNSIEVRVGIEIALRDVSLHVRQLARKLRE